MNFFTLLLLLGSSLASAVELQLGDEKINLKYSGCRMKGHDLEAFFGTAQQIKEGSILHFTVKNINNILKQNPDKNTLDISDAIGEMYIQEKGGSKWQSPKDCKLVAAFEDSGIYFSLSCKLSSDSKKEIHISIKQHDNLVCFPSGIANGKVPELIL